MKQECKFCEGRNFCPFWSWFYPQGLVHINLLNKYLLHEIIKILIVEGIKENAQVSLPLDF